MPLVSVVIAAYNRADAIQRAVRSVQAQTFSDWELILVDDGSTDGTASLVEGMDPRLKILRQKNSGFAAARNNGLRATTGTYVAFLDDDDEWMPHHLELAVRFLNAHPDAHFVNFELREDFGQGRHLLHYKVEVNKRYPSMAEKIGSRRFDLPPGETDPYRRVYDRKELVGDWGRPVLERAGIHTPVYHYSGNIFRHLCWGYLLAVNPLVVRRQSLAEVGFQNEAFPLAADYHLIADLCRRYTAHFVAVPTYIKHELAPTGKPLASSHIVTGSRALRCAIDHVRSFEEHFWKENPEDRELGAMRAWKHFGVARIAVEVGERAVALEFLKSAQASLPGFWRARSAEWVVRAVKSPSQLRGIYLAFKKLYFAILEVREGHLSPLSFAHKSLQNLSLFRPKNR